jgi:hypothetical protein
MGIGERWIERERFRGCLNGFGECIGRRKLIAEAEPDVSVPRPA